MCGADNLANPYSLSIEQDGCRHSTHAERAGQRTAIIDQLRQVNDANLGIKGIDLGHARPVLADGQNFDTFGNVRSPQRVEVRRSLAPSSRKTVSGAGTGICVGLKLGVSSAKASHDAGSALASGGDMPTMAAIRSPAAKVWDTIFSNFTETPGATAL